ncbi:MAG: aldehyde ferredoxin oxidoreductase C-terminal domain-containing protein [Anaerolineales bacterium]|jgi:aldehyde:ferredoxin oxidoreductase
MTTPDIRSQAFKVRRISLDDKQSTLEPAPDSWSPLGGRALLARIMLDELDATCDPLGSKNKLIFALGLLVGHRLSSCDRISIGGKSPLTGGVKESNAGGRTGLQMAQLGMKALILEGSSSDWNVVHISADGVRFEPADELLGLGVHKAAIKLVESYGDHVAIALIGPAGERQMLSAGIQNLDKDRVPSRIAARGGLGALMGAKRVKAIVFDGSAGEDPPISDPKAFKAARKAYTKALLDHPQTTTYREYGTAAMTMMCNTTGALPTRNFTAGEFEGAEQLSGETLRSTLLSRGGKCNPSHACMLGCAIQSSNVYETAEGDTVVSPLEYETIGMMGSNLEIDSLDAVARLNYLANDLGIDTIELGAALGVAAEAGKFQFGDAEGALELVEQICEGTDLGHVLGNGAQAAGEYLGVERVPAVKRQAMSAYDPRAIKGTGVTYATSPQGADHTCGLTIRAKVDHLSPEGQIEVSRNGQYRMAGLDSLGACIFAGFGFSADPDVIPALIHALYGWEVDTDYVDQLGKESLRLELAFNKKAGFTREDDRLPGWMGREPLPPHNTVFDVSPEDMDSIFENEFDE